MIGELDISLQVFNTLNTGELFGQLRILPVCQYYSYYNNNDLSHLEKRTKFFMNSGHNNLMVLFREKDTLCI